jgi:hypothetical protein
MTRAGVGVTFPTLAQGRDASPVASPCEHPVFQARPICQAPSGSSGARRSPPPEPGPFHLSRPSSRKGVMPGGRYSCGVEKTGQVVDRSSDREEAAEPASACLLASTNPDDHSGRDRYQPAPPPDVGVPLAPESEARARGKLRTASRLFTTHTKDIAQLLLDASERIFFCSGSEFVPQSG